MGTEARVALVTGANRGIGHEVSRQLAAAGHAVALSSRDLAKGRAGAEKLAAEGLDVVTLQLDVTDPESVAGLSARLEAELGGLDVLVNNAGILDDMDRPPSEADIDVVRASLETNALGAWRVAEAVLPLLRRSHHGRIVNVSSGAGSLTEMKSWAPAYSISKAALNAVTRMLAAELRADGILVNAVCPGWVATDMGRGRGRPVAEGAAGVVWAATLPDDGPTGGFFRDGDPIAW